MNTKRLKTPSYVKVILGLSAVLVIGCADSPKEKKAEEIVEVEVVDPEVNEDYNFSTVEFVPIFPGCEEGSNTERKACFNLEMQKFVAENFNTELANELGLPSGEKKIIVQFKIDENGEVTEIRSRAPHKKLQEEIKRVLRTLPKMTPAKQDSKAVGVKYSLPISLNVK